MEFEPLKEAGNLDVGYAGTPLDLHSFGVFHTNMQDIIDKVAFVVLSEAGVIDPGWRRPRYIPARVPVPYRRIVRGDISSISIGSLLESISFGVAIAFADPNVRAVLQNLAANIIWAASLSGVRGIVGHARGFLTSLPSWRNRSDPFEIGPNLRDILHAVAENNGERDSEIQFKCQLRNQETMEIKIRLRGRQNDRSV